MPDTPPGSALEALVRSPSRPGRPRHQRVKHQGSAGVRTGEAGPWGSQPSRPAAPSVTFPACHVHTAKLTEHKRDTGRPGARGPLRLCSQREGGRRFTEAPATLARPCAPSVTPEGQRWRSLYPRGLLLSPELTNYKVPGSGTRSTCPPASVLRSALLWPRSRCRVGSPRPSRGPLGGSFLGPGASRTGHRWLEDVPAGACRSSFLRWSPSPAGSTGGAPPRPHATSATLHPGPVPTGGPVAGLRPSFRSAPPTGSPVLLRLLLAPSPGLAPHFPVRGVFLE